MKSFKQQVTRISPLSISLVLLFASVMTFVLLQAFAAIGPATLYTSPGGSQSVTKGQNFTVSVRVSTASNVPVTGAAVYLSYPTDKLQVVSQSYSGSSYTTQLAASNSGGVLRMDRAAFPMITGGDKLFAQVTFKAINTGAASLSFGSNSIVTSGEDDSNILSSRNGVTYNISNPAAPPSGGSSSSGGQSGSSGGSSGGSSSSSSDSSSTDGTTDSSGSSSSSNDPADSPDSEPGVAANNSADTSAARSSGSAAELATSSVAIIVVDEQNKPVSNAEVKLGKQTVKTNKDGVALFSSVPVGSQQVFVSYNGNETTQALEIKGASKQNPQENFKVTVKRDGFNPIILVVPVLLLLVASGLLLLHRQGKLSFHKPHSNKSAATIFKSPVPKVSPTPKTPEELHHSHIPFHSEKPGTVYRPSQSAQSTSNTAGSSAQK